MTDKDHLETHEDLIRNIKRTNKKLTANQFTRGTVTDTTETTITSRKAATKTDQDQYTNIGTLYNDRYGTVSLMTVNIDLEKYNSVYNILKVAGDISLVFNNLALGHSIDFVLDIENTVASPVITFVTPVSNLPTLPSASGARYLLHIYGVHDSLGTRFSVISSDIGGASGANVALSNLSGVAINTSLISDTDVTDDLGSSSKHWKNLYIREIYFKAGVSTPAANGVFYFDGTDVKVKTGGVSKNLSDIGGASGANQALSNLTNPTSINQDLVPQANKDLGLNSSPWRILYGQVVDIPSAGSSNTGRYQIFRNATPAMVYNVPTGAMHLLTINGVTAALISSSGTTVGNLVADRLSLQPNPATPALDGVMALNGSDVRVFSGGALRNLSDIVAGANQALSNLTNPTSINQDLVPQANKDLGTSGTSWRTGYINQIDLVSLASSVTTRYQIYRSSTPALVQNVPTGAQFQFQVNGANRLIIANTFASLTTGMSLLEITLQPNPSAPALDGVMNSDGTHVRVMSGGVLRSLSNVGGLHDLNDVHLVAPSAGQYLRYGGAQWANVNILSADIPNLDASKITTGTLGAARGGTGNNSYLVGDLLYATGATTLSKRNIGASFQKLGVVSGVPNWVESLPYISNTVNAPSGAQLDSWFGSGNGAAGIQYYSTSAQVRIWGKANGTWWKNFLT